MTETALFGEHLFYFPISKKIISMLLGFLKRRAGIIRVCFLVDRSKFPTKNAGKHEQMSPLTAGSEDSLGHISPSTLLLVCGGLRSPGGMNSCICWESALLWDSAFCREQHSCGQTCSCHRQLSIAKLK